MAEAQSGNPTQMRMLPTDRRPFVVARNVWESGSWALATVLESIAARTPLPGTRMPLDAFFDERAS
jgi:hypothetical protein